MSFLSYGPLTEKDQKAADEWQARRGDWHAIRHLRMEWHKGAAPATHPQCDRSGEDYVWRMSRAQIINAFYAIGVPYSAKAARRRLQDNAILTAREKEEAMKRVTALKWEERLSTMQLSSATLEGIAAININDMRVLTTTGGFQMSANEAQQVVSALEDPTKRLGKNISLAGDQYIVTEVTAQQLEGTRVGGRFYIDMAFLAISSGRSVIVALYDCDGGDVAGDLNAVRRMVETIRADQE